MSQKANYNDYFFLLNLIVEMAFVYVSINWNLSIQFPPMMPSPKIFAVLYRNAILMTTKRYNIFLDDKIIGTTELEKADTPMGVVFGNVQFDNIVSGYNFLKAYCLNNNIEIIIDYPSDNLIATTDIPNLKVFNPGGIEIKGQGTNINGMDSDVFEITILGVSYLFFEEEFPHHVKAYNDQLKET